MQYVINVLNPGVILLWIKIELLIMLCRVHTIQVSYRGVVYTATTSVILLPRPMSSPLRAWAGFLSWFRSCCAHRDGSTAEICSGQASSECVCLTVGPLNMDPLMEVRPREQHVLVLAYSSDEGEEQLCQFSVYCLWKFYHINLICLL